MPGFGNDVDAARPEPVGMAYTTRASGRVVNDLRVRLQPRGDRRVSREPGSIDNASVGLPALATNPRDAGLSLISVAGFSPIGHEYNNPQESASDTFQISDTATWTAARTWSSSAANGTACGSRRIRDVQARGFLHVRRSRATPATRSRICCSACRC